jgi:hypothetical protein
MANNIKIIKNGLIDPQFNDEAHVQSIRSRWHGPKPSQKDPHEALAKIIKNGLIDPQFNDEAHCQSIRSRRHGPKPSQKDPH